MESTNEGFTKYTVAVRVRPPANTQIPISFTIPNKKSITQERPTSIVTYSFDQVFEPSQNNQDIYQGSLKGFLQRGLTRKLHSTVLAYGQTGSGKTHTLFGHQNNGLIHCIGKQLFHDQQQYKITCSVLQIYNQKIIDLITNGQIKLLDDAKGNTIIQGLQVTEIKSISQFQNYLKNMNKNKIFGNSYIHNESSRSHVILTLRINGVHINIVDLCGSQVLTYNFNEKQRQQTNNINLSLFTLNTVLSEICDNRNKHIPYRNSVLTRLLKNSLSSQNTCQIYMICTIAPQTEHIEMSRKTLRFGQLAIEIDENGVKQQVVNLSQQKRQSKKVKNIIDQKLDIEQYQYYGFKWKTEVIEIFEQNVKIYKINWEQQQKQTLVFLHAYGYGCDGTDWNVFVDKILKKFPKVRMLSVDFPGFGKSGGKKFVSRSQKFSQKNQPIDFMKKLFEILKLNTKKSLTLIGYDLGGAIALSSCLDTVLTKLISNVICFHPTWTDSIQNLAPITQRVLLLWMNVQTFHLVNAGQKMSRTIKNSTLYRFNIGPYNDEKSEGFYNKYCRSMSNIICQFISETPNYTLIIQKEKKITERGKVTQIITVIPLTKQEQLLMKSCTSIKQYFQLISQKKQKNVYQSLLKTTENTPKYTSLAGNLFQLSPKTLSYDTLIKLGLLKQSPKNHQILKGYPMYCSGRRVQVRTTIQLNMLIGNTYLKYQQSGDIACTHHAWISSNQNQQKIISTQKILIDVQTIDNKLKQIELPLLEMIELNQETPFSSINGNYIFEDSVTCKYYSSITKLKMYQCLYHTKELIAKLDFRNNTKQLLETQKQIAKRIVKLIDLRHLVHQGIDNTRYTGTDVGKLAYRGQGNCHHLASVGAALLLPFGKLCGWDVVFRAGSCLKAGREIDNEDNPLPGWNGKPKLNVQDHTWLQIVYKPSLVSVVFDPSFNLQNYELDKMYQPFSFHISGKPQCVVKEQTRISIPNNLFDEKITALK